MKSWQEQIDEAEGFEWDQGNKHKSVLKHKITGEEAEQVFKNDPLLLLDDLIHSKNEKRAYAFGKSNNQKLLTISFTMRGKLIRIISARPMSRKERKRYEQED